MKFIVTGVLILIVLLSFTEPIEGTRKKRKNEKYIGNDPDKNEHIHSGRGFDVFKDKSGKHRDLRIPGQVDYLLNHPEEYDDAKDTDAIDKKLQKMKKHQMKK